MSKTQISGVKRKVDRIVSSCDDSGRDTKPKKEILKENSHLKQEVSHLRSRLEELEQTLNAIRSGEVDALVISGPEGESVYSLAGAEHPYRVMVESMGEGAVTLTTDGTILYANTSFSQMLKLPLEQVIGSLFRNYLQPENVRDFQDALAHSANSQLEAPLIDRNGSKIPVYLSISRFDDQNTPAYFTVIATDLTDQKNAELLMAHERELTEEVERRRQIEETLRKSEERFRVAQELSPDGFTILHPIRNGEGRVVDFTWVYENEAIARLNGTDPRAISGRKLLDVFPGHKGTQILETYRRVAETGEPSVIEAMYEGDSLPRSTWFRLAVVSMGDDIAVLAQDITESRVAKDELEDKVRERTAQYEEANTYLLKEIQERKSREIQLQLVQKNLQKLTMEIIKAEEKARQNLATDLHDTVVQSLGAAKLRSQLIQDQIPKKAKAIFTDLQNLISDSITQSRSIMAEMSPPVLNELGLESALEWLTEQATNKHGLNVVFKSMNGSAPLAHDVRVLLFQATRELLMNIVKHAQANNVKVKLYQTDQRVRIEVTDNGRGFDTKMTYQPNMTGGFGLFSIGERLRHIGGVMAIKSAPGHGTTIILTAPREIETITPE